MLAPGTPAIGSHASLFRTVRAVSVNAGLSFLRFAPPREFLCDAGVQACRISGTAPVIPGDLVVSVFRVARPCRRPGGQCLPPFVFFCLFFFFCLCLFLLLSPSLLGCAPLLVPVRWWPVVCCFCVSRDQGSPLVHSELPTACRLPGPAPKAVVPTRFVVSVFHVTRPCRLPDGQCWPPLVFGVFCFISSSFLVPFSGVLPMLVPVRW